MTTTTPGTRDARRVVVGATLAFALLLIIGGALILWARHRALDSVFDFERVWTRAGVGALIGALAAVLCALVVWTTPGLARLRRLAEQAVDGIEPRWHTMLVIAVSAGVSEEFFFRGVLEPEIGSWLSALAFMALHGVFRHRDRGTLLFAVFLFGASMGLTAINRWQGLECAMAAHAAYDLVMLAWLSRARAQ